MTDTPFARFATNATAASLEVGLAPAAHALFLPLIPEFRRMTLLDRVFVGATTMATGAITGLAAKALSDTPFTDRPPLGWRIAASAISSLGLAILIPVFTQAEMNFDAMGTVAGLNFGADMAAYLLADIIDPSASTQETDS